MNELIALLKQNNIEAYTMLYDKYAPALYTVVLQIVRDDEIAKNVFEKAFLDIKDKIGTYDASRERLFIWMFKIVRNAAINVIRSKDDPQIFEQEAKKTFEKIADLEIDNYGLRKIVMKLKIEQSLLLDLCYYKGYNYAEIAEALNIPVETVNQKLRMAVLELKAALL